MFGADEDAFVTVAVTGGSADDGVDYDAFAAALATAVGAYAGDGSVTFDAGTGLLTFTAGATDGDELTPIEFSVAAEDDNLVEGDEDFAVALSAAGSSTGADISEDATVLTTTITDNDTANFTLTQALSLIHI